MFGVVGGVGLGVGADFGDNFFDIFVFRIFRKNLVEFFEILAVVFKVF